MNCQKELFQLDPSAHYLNCAYVAPLLKTAEEACLQALVRQRNPFNIVADDYFDQATEVRAQYALLINALPQNIAFIPSTSYGFASVLNNVKAKPNGNAVTIENEFPSGYFSLKRWCAENANEMLVVAPPANKELVGEDWNAALLEHITEDTSVVLVSAVHWMTGLRFDVEAIGKRCKEMGAKFIVDGTQSVGARAMDVQKFHIDALICATYKWMFGPYSLALAYIHDDFSNGKPLEETWMNRTNAKNFSTLTEYDEAYKPSAGKFNVGEASNFILMPMLQAALKQILSWGPENIQAYSKQLIQPLLNYMRSLGVQFENEAYFSNHLFTLRLPVGMDANALREKLNENKIYISVRGSNLRIAVNVFNDEKDIQKLLEVIQEAVREAQLSEPQNH